MLAAVRITAQRCARPAAAVLASRRALMTGLMQDKPLLISSLLEHAVRFHPHAQVISRTVEGPMHRYSYAELAGRAKQLGNALTHELGVVPGDFVATMAWNGYRHMEAYFGISGIGAVCHTINPRLSADQIAYIISHAGSKFVLVDATFLPIVEKIAHRLPSVRGWIVMSERAAIPAAFSVPGLRAYEDLLAPQPSTLHWPVFPESTASSCCYTSGTTGNPKGVLYSHRSTALHSFAACAVDGLGLSARDRALLVVPMFHVNAWGMPYAAAMCGAELLLPGPKLDGASVASLMQAERPTIALGVPTVWMALLQYLEANRSLDGTSFGLERVVIGGSAAPRACIEGFREHMGARVLHAWGMTELSPLGTIGNKLRKHAQLDREGEVRLQLMQGRPPYGVDLALFDDHGAQLPHDGKTIGHLKARGPWVIESYFKEATAVDADGWFATGDVGTIDPDGYLRITDRSKDVVKSGGEFISSVDVENAAAGHPGVQQAAVIGMPHRKWGERPLLIVVVKPGASVTQHDLLDFMRPHMPRWWLPDDVRFVSALPHTATGKVLKRQLREDFARAAYRFPTDE